MGFKNLKHKSWFKIVSNKYVFIGLIFGIWMLFFDSNSWLVQRDLNQEIDKLQNDAAYYQKEIHKDSTIVNQLKTEEGRIHYAREHYFMKRSNEDVFIIQYQDSLKESN